jgi:hypothetical protein
MKMILISNVQEKHSSMNLLTHPPFIPPSQILGKGGKRSGKRDPQGKPPEDPFFLKVLPRMLCG